MESIRAVVRAFHSPDAHDLESYTPADPETFGFLLQVLAGPDAGPGEESFDVIVCSPKWLEGQMKVSEIRSGRHHLMMRSYDWAALQRDVRRRVESCQGETWSEVASKVARLGHWEFEDYTA